MATLPYHLIALKDGQPVPEAQIPPFMVKIFENHPSTGNVTIRAENAWEVKQGPHRLAAELAGEDMNAIHPTVRGMVITIDAQIADNFRSDGDDPENPANAYQDLLLLLTYEAADLVHLTAKDVADTLVLRLS